MTRPVPAGPGSTPGSDAEAAAALFLGEATVEAHVSRLFAELGVTDRVQVAIVVHDAGWS